MKIPMFGYRSRIDEGKKYDLVAGGNAHLALHSDISCEQVHCPKTGHRRQSVAFSARTQTTSVTSFEKMAHRCGKKSLGTLKLVGPEIDTDAGDLRIKQYIDL